MAARLLIGWIVLFSTSAWAHEGPPYPLATGLKTEFGPMTIWTDPDVGDGTFMFVFDEIRKLPLADDLQVSVRSANQEIQLYTAQMAAEKNYIVKVPFSREGTWTVSFKFGSTTPLELPVEVTPPGPSRGQIWIFLFPFVLVGLLWGKVLWARRDRWA